MRHTLFSTIHSMTSQATRRTALAILALALALFCGSGPSAKRATTESDFSGNSAKLRGRAALDYLKQQGVYDSLEAANINSTITQVKQVTASDGAADDELGYAVAVDGDTLVVGAYQCTVGANNKGNAVAFPMTITSSCPTSFMVNDLGDAVDATPGNSVCATAGGVCTLRAAIQEANAIGATCSPLTINFSVTGTITLGSALPALDHPNLTITGPGTSSLTVSGATLYRPFTINSGKVVAISGLTVANGFNVTQAGGIENNGTLTINNCAIRNNKSGQSGGIQNNGTLVMNNCTVHGNMSTGFGGGIASFGSFTTTLNNCTISGNTATADAAGLATGGTWFLTNCTVVNNTAGSVGGGIEIYSANVTLKNTIVANNTSSSIPATGNLDGSVNLNSASSFNLIGTGNTLGLTNGVNGNITGVTTPLLGTFATYGGTTQTIPLLPGSPAINAGTASGAPTTDQRGKARFGTTDIGAFESQGFTLTVGNGDNQSAAVNTAFAAPLVVNVDAINSTDSEPVNGGRVTFTVPGSGASCSLATNPATISSGSASAGTATANGIAGGPYMVTATTGAGTLDFNLTNTAPQAVFTFSVASTNFNEAVGMAFFSIQRANTGVPVSVGYATGGGTATAGACAPGVDYVAASGTMNFGANEMNKTFSVTICNDTVYEANQTFNVTLSNPMGGTIGTTGTVIATIRNDDAAPTVAINDLSNAEGNSGTTNFQTTFTVSGASEVAGGFTFQSTDGTATAPSDYAAINTTAALPANVNRTTETLNGSLLAVTGDTIFEPNETVLLNGSSCTDCMFADNQGVATIQNDDCPTSFTVNDLGDAGDATPGNNVCETATGNGVCTLRAALQEANALTACTPFTINFSVMGTITLGSALPAIAHPNLTINGPGAANLTVSGNNLYRVLEIASGSHNVNLSGLTLANGYIKAADTTAMSGTNQAPDGLGGGLYSLSTGAVNVTDCVITNNTAQGGNATGGTNVFGGEGIGAGIYLQSGTGTAKLTRCTISNNSALGGLGMGGTTQTLDGTGRGAGVYKHSGSLTVEDCTIADNITDRIDGSVLSSFTNARGAGLFNASGALAVTGSTFSGNRRPNTLTLAGAAIQNTANITWTMTNSTFSGNTGSNTIVLIAGTLTMVNCTVANNTLSTTISSAGAIFNQIGSTLNLKNTLLGNNTDGPNIKNFGTVTSQGNNFDSDGTTTFTNGVNGDIVGTSVNKTDPLLSILGNYGGLTQTQALLPGSPAINAGTSSGAPATDQRGITRVGNTDIGAFESRGFTLAIAGGNNQSAVTSTAFANPLAVLVTSAFSEPVNGGQITFTLPGSGPSANLANNPATITGGTATTGTVTANAVTGGPYPVAATTNGAPAGVNFFLTNTCQTITVSPATLAGNATTGQTFTQTFTQMNGTGAITWSLIGTAPPGLSFDAMTATLSGSPSASGSFNFTVRATDGNNCFGERQYTLGVDCQTVTLSPMEPALAGGTAGTPYSQSFTAAGGALPHNFSVSGGTLPTGLMLAANGALTGTPTAFGNFNFTVRATDANECFGERAYTVRICGVISLTVSLPNGTTGVAYSQTITASGGAPPSSFAVTAGSLPPGLSLNGDGTLSGTPTQSGSFTFTVTATDPLGCTGSQNYIVNIGCQTVTIDQTVLTNGFAGTAYNQTLTATGGTAPYSFAVSGGALPGGINLSSGGALSGLPTTQSTFNFTVRATDAYGCFGEQSFTVLISGDGLMFYPLPSPVRLLDTRAGLSPNACSQPEAPISGGTSRTQMARNFCGLPANAQAITGNITTVQSGGGYLTLYPSDAAQPLAANSNYEPNEILNNVFTVGLGAADGAFKIFVTSGTDVVIDVTGYYAPPAAGGLFFHPLPKPIRLLETRNGFTGCNSPAMPLPGGVETAQNTHLTCDGVTIPTTARAITGNATTVSPTGPGFPYLTLFPADAARPLVANSNYLPGQIMNAPFTVGLNAAGEFKIYPTTQTDLVIDVLGYFSPEALDANGAGLLFTPLGKPVRLLETRAGFAGCFATGTPLLAGSTQTQTARGICNGETVTATALGIVGNVTVVNAESGYLTFWPSTALQPTIATSNFSAGQIFNRHFTAGLGMSDGAFKIFTQSRTDLVIDVSGFFAP